MEKPSAYQGDETYVFVCYAHEDSDTVYPEIAWLQAEGVNVWYDEGISLGTEWTQALADAIQGCAKFLFLVTPNSVNRENCRRELNFAQEEGRDVLAVHLQPTDVPSGLRLSLNNRQAIFRHQLPDKQYRNEILQALLSTAAKSAMVAIPPRSPIRALRLAAFAVATVLIVVAGAWWFDDGDKESAELVEAGTQAELIDLPRSTLLQNSIAVLPFENLSPDPDNAYFAAGIHEEIINQLVKIRDLSVIARTSVMQYAGVHKPIVEIANDLNVSTVMAGRVRYAGNRVRITAQLIDGESGTNLWSEAYEEDLENVFGIQLDIATQIAGTLEAELSPTERERIARRATDSPEAYTHYLRALNSWGTFAPTSAIHRELEAAVELDPDFAAALAFDSTVYALERHPRIAGPNATAQAARQSTILAEELARRALELDANEARAHFALAGVDLFYWRWESAYLGLERAYALNPNDYLLVSQAGYVRILRRDIAGGLELMQRSIELNPADVANVWNNSHALYHFQQWQEAERQARLATSMADQLAFGYALLARVLSRTGDKEEARQNAALAEARNPDVYALADIALAYGQLGDSDAAKRLFDLAGAGDESKLRDLQLNFWMHMATKQYDAALGYLERAINENFPFMAAMELHQWSEHPDYDPIRSRPRFRQLVRVVSNPREFSRPELGR